MVVAVSDVIQAEHCGAVGNDDQQISARAVLVGAGGVLDDLLAGRGHAGRIAQREVARVDHLLGRRQGAR